MLFPPGNTFFLPSSLKKKDISYRKYHTRGFSEYLRNEFEDFDETFRGLATSIVRPWSTSPFSSFSFGEIGQRAGCHSKSAQTYSWSRLIIDIYNGDKFHRDFWPRSTREQALAWRHLQERRNGREEKNLGRMDRDFCRELLSSIVHSSFVCAWNFHLANEDDTWRSISKN